MGIKDLTGRPHSIEDHFTFSIFSHSISHSKYFLFSSFFLYSLDQMIHFYIFS